MSHNRICRPFALALVAVTASLSAAQSPPVVWRSEGPFLGSATDVAIDASRPDTVYLSTVNGGVYRSDDGGQTWQLPGDEMTSRNVRWVEVDPANANTVWAGEDDPGNPAMWRSTDRGATWKLVTDSYKGELTTLHPVGWRLAFAPSKPTDIWVPSTSLNFRSRDGGKTWSDFRVPGQDVYAIAAHPTNPDVVWAGGTGDKHKVSRTVDGGRTWTPAGKGIDKRVSLLVTNLATPPTLYAVTSSDLYRSTDNGETFAPLTSPVSGTDDILKLIVEPGTPGATPRIWAATERALFTSTDGERWTRTDRGTGRYLVTSVAFHPRDPKLIVAAGGGAGAYRSTTGGETWTASNAGLAAGWVEELYATPGTTVVFARTSVGTFRRDDTGAWTELQAPFVKGDKEVELDGFLFDKSAGSVWAFEGNDAWRSTDGGRNFTPLDAKRSLTSVDDVSFRSLAQHPQNPNVLWAGTWTGRSPGTSVYKTTDGGRQWRRSGKGLPTEAVTMLRTAGPDEVLALVERRELFATRDGGESWISVGRGLPDADVLQLAVDPTSPNRVFIATVAGLFRSTDGGATFTKIGSALEKQRVRAVAVSPDGLVFAGAFGGVFVSQDGGSTWTTINGSLPNTNVRALAIGGGAEVRLWAGLAGGSVWSAALPRR